MNQKRLDRLLFVLLCAVIVGLPAAMAAYDHHLWREKIPAGAKVFTLTGNTAEGWILGDVPAYDALVFGLSQQPYHKPVIEVSVGDRVVLKLKSSDVVHGFSLKDFGVFVTTGIQPGKTILVSFTADKAGRFTFSCNVICGPNHKNMQGVLIVRA